MDRERCFDDRYLIGEPKHVTSPSGAYRLEIRGYGTGPHTWRYSRGTVWRIADGALVCDIKRNYSTFHHSFVNKGGPEYLIAGRSYMSQTIVDLDRGTVYEPPGDQYCGTAFCWARCYLSPDGNTLAVDGCYWGNQYEVQFFDFTDPAIGWPRLPLDGADELETPWKSAPRWLDALTLELEELDDGDAPLERTRVERQGDRMVVTDHWLADQERDRRAAEAEAERAEDAWWESFSTADPMYLRLLQLDRQHALPSDSLYLQPGARRVTQRWRRTSPPGSADFDWDVAAGTIEITRYAASGDQADTLTFPGTLDGLEAAIAAVAPAFPRAP